MKPEILTQQCEAKPQDVGFDSKKIDVLNTLFCDLIEKDKLQGASYIISRKGKVFAHNAMGKLSAFDDTNKPLKPDSIRPIASLTKTFTSTAIMQLIENGKLELAQPVADFIEEFDTDQHRGINIFHLLTHTAGFKADPGYFCEPHADWGFWGRIDDNPDWIKEVLKGPIQSKPGEEWSYSSSGFFVLGEIIARISGMKYHEYILKNIIEPLGMTRTFFEIPKELQENTCLVNDDDKKYYTMTIGKDDIIPTLAGGGLYSSLADMHTFGQMMLNNGTYNGAKILGRITAQKMVRNHLDNIPAFYWNENLKAMPYGLGWYIEYRSIVTPGTYCHEGAGRCALYVDPAEDLVFAYLVPSTHPWVPESCLNPLAIVWSGIE